MVFDCFTFFNELDLLELRLQVLDPYVDKFILVESRQTFTGLEKPLYYSQEYDRFKQWNDKIIHIVAPNIEIKSLAFERHWLAYALIEATLQTIGEPNDIAFCSDLDEIWNPLILQEIDDLPHSLAQLNYCYFLNQRSSEQWVGTLMSKIKNISVGFNKENRTTKPNILEAGGWHFTNMGGAEQILKKVQAYDHGPELNQDWLKEHTQTNIDQGLDYLGRKLDYYSRPFEFWVEEENWPTYLKENRDKYAKYLK